MFASRRYVTKAKRKYPATDREENEQLFKGNH